MASIQAIIEGDLEWAFCVVSLLASVLPDNWLLFQMRGFGRLGMSFGRRRGSWSITSKADAATAGILAAMRYCSAR